MIAQRFEFTRHLLKEWNNLVYFRLKKRPCGFKDQARARQSGEERGLYITERMRDRYEDLYIDANTCVSNYTSGGIDWNMAVSGLMN